LVGTWFVEIAFRKFGCGEDIDHARSIACYPGSPAPFFYGRGNTRSFHY
jgi:hypothetical protein